MFSIFHFFADLMAKRADFMAAGKLEKFPFDKSMLSCERTGRFPDMAIRVSPGNLDNSLTSGGELIELKDAQGYSIASFNSTIPTGEKEITGLVAEGKLGLEMAMSGDRVYDVPVRQVYYLLRGRHKKRGVKVCLTHGSFFETIAPSHLIKESFRQALGSAGVQLPEETLAAMAKQEAFSTSRKVDKASVSLRFRIMAEVQKDANIFRHEEIEDNTLNLIVPLHSESESNLDKIEQKIRDAADNAKIQGNGLQVFRIKHPFNGWFLVMQVPLNTE